MVGQRSYPTKPTGEVGGSWPTVLAAVQEPELKAWVKTGVRDFTNQKQDQSTVTARQLDSIPLHNMSKLAMTWRHLRSAASSKEGEQTKAI